MADGRGDRGGITGAGGKARPGFSSAWRKLAMAMALVLTGGMAAGGPGGGVARADEPATSAGNRLVIGAMGYPTTFDLTADSSPAIAEVFDENVFEHLVQLTPSGAIVPELATGYTVSSDRRRYVFQLRRHVRFSNRDRLTAADVVFSLTRAANPASQYPDGSMLADVRSVEALAPSRVRVTLKTPDREFLYSLAATSDGVILDPSTVADLATHPVGTGPFRYRASVPGSTVTLTRNPSYWGSRPKLATVVFRYFGRPDLENSALLGGDINVIDNEGIPALAGTFKSNPGFRVLSATTTGKVQLTINNASGPLSLVAVRQAIADAINRRAIDKTVTAGYGVTLGSDAVPGDPYYLDLADQYPYSLEKAKQLLAQAGYPNGFSTTLLLPDDAYAQVAGPLIAAELGQVGIVVTVSDAAPATWTAQVDRGDYGLTIANQPQGRDLFTYGDPSAPWHYAYSDQVEALLEAGDTATTQQAWINDYQQALRLITSDAVNDWLYVQPQIMIAQKSLTGLVPSGLSDAFPLAGVAWAST